MLGKNLSDFVNLYKQGYHYLILDPQAYISWTKDTQRFSPPLIDYLQWIYDDVPPVAKEPQTLLGKGERDLAVSWNGHEGRGGMLRRGG